MHSNSSSSMIHILRSWFQEGALWALFGCMALSSLSLVLSFSMSHQLTLALETHADGAFGADAMLSGQTSQAFSFEDQAVAHHLKISKVVETISMIVQGEKVTQTTIIGLDEAFPLKGSFKTTPEARLHQGKNVYGSSSWLTATSLSIGSELRLGDLDVHLDGEVIASPILDMNTMLTPRLFMSLETLMQTGLIAEHSRAYYRLFLSGSSENLNAFKAEIEPNLSNSLRWYTPSLATGLVKTVMDRGGLFIQIALFMNLFMGMISLGLLSYYVFKRQEPLIALMQVLGATRFKSTFSSLQAILVVSLVAACLGGLVAYGLLNYGAIQVLAYLDLEIEPVSPYEIAQGCLFSVLAMWIASSPLFVALFHSSPLVLLRQRQAPIGGSLVWGLAWSFPLGLYAIFVFPPKFMALLLASILGLGAGGFIVVQLCTLVAGILVRTSSVSLRLASRSLQIQEGKQLFGVALCGSIMLVTSLSLIYQGVIKHWFNTLGETHPNYFLINIPDREVVQLKTLLREQNIELGVFYPTARARLVRVNGVSVETQGADQHRFYRPLVVTWGPIPDDNQITQGVPWSSVSQGLSVEKDFANRLDLKLGDTLGFAIGDKQVEAKIQQLRSVQWDNFQPNFFVIFTPNLMEDLLPVWMTSVYIPPMKEKLLSELTQSSPSTRLYDVKSLLLQARALIQVLMTMGSLLIALTVVGALGVFIASLVAQQYDLRKRQALLHVLGATTIQIRRSRYLEWSMRGLILSGLSVGLAHGCAHGVVYYLFEHNLTHPWQSVVVPWSVGVVVFAMMAMMSMRSIPRLRDVLAVSH